jgi:glycosyltransferase involved in cell wall biosynthesis
MNDSPPVSVCIPTFNGERFLDECLDSVRAQSFEDIEILIVDDNSSDETLTIARRHAAADARIRVEQNPRRLGLVGNWNRSVALARGDWIKFVFQDDVIHLRCVERLEEAGRRANATMVACARRIALEDADEETRRMYRQYSEGESLAGVFPGRTSVSAREFCDAVLDHTRKNFVGEPTAVMLRRSTFERYGRFNRHLGSMCDFEYWIRVGIHEGLTIVPERLATFRVHAAATSASLRKDRRYRLEQLDSLILLHQFVFHEEFAPLRAAAAAKEPAVRLKELFARRALIACVAAKRKDASGEPDPRLMSEWRMVVKEFPRVEKALVVRRARLLRRVGWYRLRKLLKGLRTPEARRSEQRQTPGASFRDDEGAEGLVESGWIEERGA